MVRPPEMRTPSRNKRGEQTRVELIDAAWRVVDRMSLVDLLAGLTPQVVATEAGMTTGAFRHHFAGLDELVRAMIEVHFDSIDWSALDRVTVEVWEESPFSTGAVRTTAMGVWGRETAAGDWSRRRQRLLMSACSRETEVEGRALGQLLVEGFWDRFFEQSAEQVEHALETMGRTPIPPFQAKDLARLLRALLDGLVAQWLIEPDGFDERLYPNVMAGLLVSLTAPNDRGQSLADLEALIYSDRGLSGRSDVVEIRRLAISALGLFDDPIEGVSFSQIATATGTPIDDLVRTYGSVRRMAAVAFAEVLPLVEASASRHVDRDPVRAVADTLCDIARMAQQHPHVAAALLLERSSQAVASAGQRDWAGTAADVGVVVPISVGVSRALGGLGDLGPVNVISLADDMVDLTLMYGGTRPWSPAEVAGKALLLLPGTHRNPVSSPK